MSGWDIEGSLRRIITTGSRMTDEVQEITASAAVDHNLGAMFVRMSEIAKRIALISLLVSLPLLLMAGILLANLSALLLLNERRKLGLLRLRGVCRRADRPNPAARDRYRRPDRWNGRRRPRHHRAAADLFRRDPANRISSGKSRSRSTSDCSWWWVLRSRC